MRWEGEDPRVSGLHTEEQTHGTEGLCVCVHQREGQRKRQRERHSRIKGECRGNLRGTSGQRRNGISQRPRPPEQRTLGRGLPARGQVLQG